MLLNYFKHIKIDSPVKVGISVKLVTSYTILYKGMFSPSCFQFSSIQLFYICRRELALSLDITQRYKTNSQNYSGKIRFGTELK